MDVELRIGEPVSDPPPWKLNRIDADDSLVELGRPLRIGDASNTQLLR